MNSIFMLEDNELILEASAAYLRQSGFLVSTFTRCEGLVKALGVERPNLVILDIMLPDGSGLKLAPIIRDQYGLPIMFLSARSSEDDRIKGLEIGAEDYVVKPFSNKELSLRAARVIRRVSREPVQATLNINRQSFYCAGHTFDVDFNAHIGNIDETPLELTGAEWKILFYLVSHNQDFCSREKILVEALEYEYCGVTRTIDTHIKNIRSKLKTDDWIETVRGKGYRFRGHIQ